MALHPAEFTGEIVLYQTEDGRTRLEVRFEGETVWLTQAQMGELFQTTKQNISLHIQNIYEEHELERSATVKDSLTVRQEGKRQVSRHIEYYNLDVVIAVGYRVKSHRGTQFRIWATEHLKEYMIKGFVMDDDRLKRGGGGTYFDELLARIRDIRSSEKVFWRKVLDIYATSIDYDPRAEASQQFFSTVQNKMHWASHGQTAAEVVHARADAGKSNMGLTSWEGSRPRKADAGIAKNYLTEKELDVLNRIVALYLEFAELQARARQPMYMRDWSTKLDDFLRVSGRAILTHAGKISEAYLGLLNALHQAAVHPSDESSKHFALWQTRCELFGSQEVAKFAQEIVNTNDAPRDRRNAAFRSLLDSMRADLLR